jgi:hypothetical protein
MRNSKVERLEKQSLSDVSNLHDVFRFSLPQKLRIQWQNIEKSSVWYRSLDSQIESNVAKLSFLASPFPQPSA